MVRGKIEFIICTCHLVSQNQKFTPSLTYCGSHILVATQEGSNDKKYYSMNNIKAIRYIR